MTATEKTIETHTNKEIYSMEDYTIFGKYIDTKTMNWAIENKKITDYNIIVLKNTEDEVDEIIGSLKLNVSNKEIFISCYMCLKSFEKYNDLTHLLLYTNTTEDSELSKKYIDDILSSNMLSLSKEGFYNHAIHSKNCKDLDIEVCKFEKAPLGIISCVYIFGEGFDLPKLNGTCIAGNMQSEIRIVQYISRSMRLEIGNPDKKSYLLIPYIDDDDDDWWIEGKPFEKVRNVVSQLRNVDENIEQKLVLCIKKKDKHKKDKHKKDEENNYEDWYYEENGNELYKNELYKIKLKLIHSKALGCKLSEEQQEYNYINAINKSLNIKSKKEYMESCSKNNILHNAPEKYFKGKGVWNGWYDFIGYKTDKFIQSKQEWINYCKEKKITSINEYHKSSETYDVLPQIPADFYKDFTNIPNELGFNTNRRR